MIGLKKGTGIGNLYADRDTCQLSPHFERHVLAMTAEALEGKAEIAAELAWRDREIERLRTALISISNTGFGLDPGNVPYHVRVANRALENNHE